MKINRKSLSPNSQPKKPAECGECTRPKSVQGQGQEPAPPARDLVKCHQWLSDRDPYTPGPLPDPCDWKDIERFEFAVVGAGMGGLNTAWKLQGSGKSVALFERTRHAGGRVRSTKTDNKKPIDLGAMRYIPTRHHRVAQIVETDLQLPTREFVVGGEKNLQYLRGVRLTNQQIKENPEARPYHLSKEEQGMSVDQLLSRAISKVVPNFEKLTEAEWESAKQQTMISTTDPATGKKSDVPLSQLGLKNVLSLSLSQEAQRLVTDSVGYETFLANWDAGEALEELAADFRPGTTYKTPTAGMEAIPRGVARKFVADGGEFRSLHTLRRVEYDKKHGFLLEFSDRKGKQKLVAADNVVLGLPKKPLQALVENSPDLQSTQLESSLDKVTPNPMTRIFATYQKPWWNEMGITEGRSISDLPLGQLYYYGDKEDQRPYVMAYSDGSDSSFWRGLQNPSEPGVDKRLCVKPELAEELQSQLEELHGRKLPKPDGFLYKRWGSEYTGGAYHTWKPGSKPWQTSEFMIQPDQEKPLYVCGEAYSTNQGWIEGALETSEKVLKEIEKDNQPPQPGP